MSTLAEGNKSKSEEIGLKVIRYLNKAIGLIEDVIFIIILLIALWFLMDTIHVFYNSSANVSMPTKPDGGIAALQKEISEEAVAWITIDDTSIDYPIMQGIDNYVYLNKNPYGEYSLAGSIFLDYRNASDFTDDYSVVYGHHMSGGYMFGALDDFEKEDFFEKHITGELETENGTYPIEVMGFLYTDASNELVFDPEGNHTGLEEFIKNNAINFRNVEGTNIIALTTCRSPTSTRRACLFVRILN